ncbi:hypothetical protein AAHW25_27545 (plasmid) [Klebsiella pneumoniae]|jgi:hypothetical protein|nr:MULTISPECIES: hypothetical protein [Enterobacteriaceae]TYD78244.1 hypothetical protein DJ519_30455 [Klebsiella michiganensis]HDU4019663.1 hypothetical protein [Klebsiella pneumoniae subsp. pneumoniae]PXH52942.1 hypothetical protein DMT41_30660 [Klebsiella variicola]TYF71114.1 hypothetical protein DJ537_23940 [Enterobacter hormaechei]SXP62868.1 Uncharacterised protein [Klebsiella pneumoniae]
MTRTFFLLCTGVFAIAYALYELNHYGVYYPDAINPEAFTGWKAVTELGPAILATGIAATAFSLWLFILFFRGSESRRIQREISGYQQALREAEEAHRARQNTLIQNHNLETAALRSHYSGAEDVLREAFAQKESLLLQAVQNARKEARKELEEQREALNQRGSILQKKELALEKTLEKARKYVAGERRNTALARLEAEKAEERRRNASATAERRRRKLEKLQTTDGTAGQKH